MARRRVIARVEAEGRTMVLYTTIMLILMSFFVVLVTRVNFDETKFSAAVSSIQSSLGALPGGRLSVGEDDGLPVDGIGFDQGGRLMQPELEMAQIRAVLAPALLSREASIIHTPNHRIISLSSALLFHLDSEELNPEAAETLRAFAQIVAANKAPIRVEGHTDNLPPQTAGVGDNWDISSRRAMTVLNFLVKEGGLDRARLTPFAYAGTKPLRSNATPQGRARNRRVDLVLDLSQLPGRELEEMRDKAATYNFKGFDFLLQGVPGGDQIPAEGDR